FVRVRVAGDGIVEVRTDHVLHVRREQVAFADFTGAHRGVQGHDDQGRARRVVDGVDARAARDGVEAVRCSAGQEHVVARAAVQRVGAQVTGDGVVQGVAGDVVGLRGA